MHPSPEPSLEQLLTAGCDNRIVAGPDGLNRYGCGPRPRDVIPLGSCTCCSPSVLAMERAGQVLERLRSADSTREEFDRIAGEHRDLLTALLDLPVDVDIAFSPSGTDAELLALALVMLRAEKPVTNLVVGPSEVGSGTPLAAAARHYDTVTPSGRTVRRGQPIHDRLADQVAVEHLEIRDDRGGLLDRSLIDAAVVQAVSEAVAAGRHVLLHVVAHSKTGVHAPSEACVSQIRRHMGDEVSVLVDAAQGRVGRSQLRRWLAAGYQVLFTASKFYGGPPFSGALLVPADIGRDALTMAPPAAVQDWATALADYLTAFDLPPSWSPLRRRLPTWINFGSLLRWAGGIAEIEAYQAVPPEVRAKALRWFQQAVPERLGCSEAIELLPSFSSEFDHPDRDPLDSTTTVFPFRVHASEGPLDRDSLNALHRHLNGQAAGVSEPLGLPKTSVAFHLGQPVGFRDGSSALRVAIGGELIVRLAGDAALGGSLDCRLEWLGDQLNRLGECIEQWVSRVHRHAGT